MKYISGIETLNLHYPNQKTPGDWHGPSVDFMNPKWYDTSDSIFNDFDLELRVFPNINFKVYVANHVRACLDSICDGQYSVISGMKTTLIDDDYSNNLFLNKYLELINTKCFNESFKYVLREYKMDFINLLNEKGIDWKSIMNVNN
jgi:hypothetical protein